MEFFSHGNNRIDHQLDEPLVDLLGHGGDPGNLSFVGFQFIGCDLKCRLFATLQLQLPVLFGGPGFAEKFLDLLLLSGHSANHGM